MMRIGGPRILISKLRTSWGKYSVQAFAVQVQTDFLSTLLSLHCKLSQHCALQALAAEEEACLVVREHASGELDAEVVALGDQLFSLTKYKIRSKT